MIPGDITFTICYTTTFSGVEFLQKRITCRDTDKAIAEAIIQYTEEVALERFGAEEKLRNAWNSDTDFNRGSYLGVSIHPDNRVKHDTLMRITAIIDRNF